MVTKCKYFSNIQFVRMDKIPGKFQTRQEIASEYGIHRDTLRKKLKQKNIKLPKGLVSLEHQNVIYRAFGTANSMKHRREKEKGNF